MDVRTLEGARLLRVEAFGKHLFHVFSPTLVVHVHLGMRGLWLRYPSPAPPPRRGVRLRLSGPTAAYDLIAPSTCEIVDADGHRELVSRLGPDPLRADSDEYLAVTRMQQASGVLGAAVLDQAVWSGIGNAWRAELLWLTRLDPRMPVRDVPGEALSGLWRTAQQYMALGRDAGQVVSDPTAYWCPTEQAA